MHFSTSPPPDDAVGDGINDAQDKCINTANPDQSDYDMDGIGDACDTPENTVIIDEGVLFQNDAEGRMIRIINGNCYLLYIDDNGTLTTELRPCP